VADESPGIPPEEQQKIEDNYRNPKHILTIYGVGCKLSP